MRNSARQEPTPSPRPNSALRQPQPFQHLTALHSPTPTIPWPPNSAPTVPFTLQNPRCTRHPFHVLPPSKIRDLLRSLCRAHIFFFNLSEIVFPFWYPFRYSARASTLLIGLHSFVSGEYVLPSRRQGSKNTASASGKAIDALGRLEWARCRHDVASLKGRKPSDCFGSSERRSRRSFDSAQRSRFDPIRTLVMQLTPDITTRQYIAIETVKVLPATTN